MSRGEREQNPESIFGLTDPQILLDWYHSFHEKANDPSLPEEIQNKNEVLRQEAMRAMWEMVCPDVYDFCCQAEEFATSGEIDPLMSRDDPDFFAAFNRATEMLADNPMENEITEAMIAVLLGQNSVLFNDTPWMPPDGSQGATLKEMTDAAMQFDTMIQGFVTGQ